MIKYIIFDLGGVIVDSGTSKAITTIAQKYNIPQDRVEDYLRENSPDGAKYRTSEITKEEFWKRALASWGKTINPDELNNIWVSGYSVKKNMLPLLQELKANGYILGVLSNTVEDRYKHIDSQVGLSIFFTALVISYKDHVLKPDKKAFELIMKKLNIKNPQEAVYIDDKEIHASMARSLGMNAIICKDASQLTSDLRSLGVKV